MLIQSLPTRTIKATDYIIVETPEEATSKVLWDLDALGIASKSALETLQSTVTQNKSELEGKINSAITSVYIVKGSTAFAELPAVAEGTVGWVYNITDDFETTEDFVEGAGKKYGAGTNVVVTNYSNGNKYDILGDSKVDLSNYPTKEDITSGTVKYESEYQDLTELETKVQKLETAIGSFTEAGYNAFKKDVEDNYLKGIPNAEPSS